MGLMSTPVRRIEDSRFTTGRGRYVDDIKIEDAAVGYFVRSPYAHADILGIDVEAAKQAPGVLAVFTGAELETAGIGHIGSNFPAGALANRDGSNRFDGDRALLALDRVRFVGEPVVFIVARSVNQAKDAAELVSVDYRELPAVASLEEALADGAPSIWEQAKDNVGLDWEMGDRAGVDAAFARAAHMTRIDLINNRIVVNSMEPRGAIGRFDKASGRYELHAGTQGSHPLRDTLARKIFKVPSEKIRVITPDVGGGFGMKMSLYPEYPLVLFAAERLGVPVKWISERTEAFQSDTHGRDLSSHAELAFDAEGRILALKIDTDFNLGAYATGWGPGIQTMIPMFVVGGVYKIPAIYNHVRGVFTNTVTVEAYRGAGRPEVAYIIERLMDLAARELGLGHDEIRLKNFIQPGEMPYTTAAGAVIDSGDFPRNLADCMRNARWAAFPERRAEAQRRGKIRGIGMAYYMEKTVGAASAVAISFSADGKVKIGVGTLSHGQGHETTFATIIADKLGVPLDRIELVQGDTDTAPNGGGTGGSRSLWNSGNGILNACATVIGKGSAVAAELLKADAADVTFDEGAFRVRGTNRFLPLLDVAAAARDPSKLSPALQAKLANGLDSEGTHGDDRQTFPNGCHICEVEIDPETGRVAIVGYNVVDDFGYVLNPMIVRGQVHGGVAQGIGQALLENCVYEAGSGQLLSGSFMDYCMPRADDLPNYGFAYNEILCTTNPLGIKGCGEAGTIGAAPAVMNALLDALWDRGVRHVDMPMTPLRLWEILNRR